MHFEGISLSTNEDKKKNLDRAKHVPAVDVLLHHHRPCSGHKIGPYCVSLLHSASNDITHKLTVQWFLSYVSPQINTQGSQDYYYREERKKSCHTIHL